MDPRSAERPTADELEELLCFDLYAASRAVLGLYRPLLAKLDLTYPQYLVLVVLWTRRTCSIKDLAAAMRLDHGTLSPLLRRMETAGLVTLERSAADERSVQVALTPGGDRMRSHFDDIQCSVRDSLGLDDEQVATLQATLRALVRSSAVSVLPTD